MQSTFKEPNQISKTNEMLEKFKTKDIYETRVLFPFVLGGGHGSRYVPLSQNRRSSNQQFPIA